MSPAGSRGVEDGSALCRLSLSQPCTSCWVSENAIEQQEFTNCLLQSFSVCVRSVRSSEGHVERPTFQRRALPSLLSERPKTSQSVNRATAKQVFILSLLAYKHDLLPKAIHMPAELLAELLTVLLAFLIHQYLTQRYSRSVRENMVYNSRLHRLLEVKHRELRREVGDLRKGEDAAAELKGL